MKQIAPDPTKFYSDNATETCPSTYHSNFTALNNVFTSIANDLHTTALIPNNTN